MQQMKFPTYIGLDQHSNFHCGLTKVLWDRASLNIDNQHLQMIWVFGIHFRGCCYPAYPAAIKPEAGLGMLQRMLIGEYFDPVLLAPRLNFSKTSGFRAFLLPDVYGSVHLVVMK
jgi:hypothetical protein